MELLIVIAIIGIMTTVGLVSLSSSRTNTKLQAAQREVASVIKLTQSYALQGKVADDGTGSGNMITPCGYGFRFKDSGSYEIFYNNWTTGGWGKTDCTSMNGDFNDRYWKNGPPHSKTLASFQLNNGVTLSSSVAATEIYFTVPDGGIYDNTGNAYAGSQIFTFSLSSATKNITFDSGGSVAESN